MNNFFKDKTYKSKKRYKRYKMLTTIVKSLDTFVVIATTSSSVTLSVTRIGSIVTPISTGVPCGLTFCKKLIYKIIVQKYIRYKKQYQKFIKQSNLLINYIEKYHKII